MNKKVCAIIVTYNRLALCKECIAALKCQTYPCDLFVVNNHSEDETESFLQNNKIPHFECMENIGGSGGFYMGMKMIVDKNYDYLWLMDDDCIPNEDALEKLMDQANSLSSNFGFLASKVLWTDGNLHNMNLLHPTKAINESLSLIQQATFISLLISTDTVRKVGLPIKEFFIWGDDIEYTRRITVHHQLPSYYVNNSSVVHKTKTNNGSKIAYDDIDNIDRYYYAYRNESYIYRKEGLKGRVYYVAKCAYNFLRIIFLAKDHKTKRISILLKGMKDGLIFNPKVEMIS